jgi:hypothetical protein
MESPKRETTDQPDPAIDNHELYRCERVRFDLATSTPLGSRRMAASRCPHIVAM